MLGGPACGVSKAGPSPEIARLSYVGRIEDGDCRIGFALDATTFLWTLRLHRIQPFVVNAITCDSPSSRHFCILPYPL